NFKVSSFDGMTITLALKDVQASSEFDLKLFNTFPECGTSWEDGDIGPELIASTASNSSTAPKAIVIRRSTATYWTVQSGNGAPAQFHNNYNQIFFHFCLGVSARAWAIEKSGFTLLITETKTDEPTADTTPVQATT